MSTAVVEGSLRAGRILALLVCACSSTHREHPDASNTAGTGSFDGGAADGAAGASPAQRDASIRDAGTRDASMLDANAVDGSAPDTGIPDATTPDATVPEDATVPDASTGCAEPCDPLQGLSCDPELGRCVGACAPESLGASHLGCDFWPTMTFNTALSLFMFGVVLTNPGDEDATLHLSRGGDGGGGVRFAVPARDGVTIGIPWSADLKGPDVDGETGVPSVFEASVYQADGAYRLRTNRPIGVQLLSPAIVATDPPEDGRCGDRFGDGSCRAATSDAVLLLPAHVLGRRYTVTAPQTNTPEYFGGAFVAITAIADATRVVIQPRARTLAGDPELPALEPGQVYEFVMNRGDVAEFMQDYTVQGELAGTTIEADRPIQVLTGNPTIELPSSAYEYTDHCEEIVLPREAFDDDYLVTLPAPAGTPATRDGHLVRIFGLEDGTALTYDPAVPGPSTIGAGEVVEFEAGIDFRVQGTTPFAVASFTLGGSLFGGEFGDPSQTVVVPTERFLDDYAFTTPGDGTGYGINYVNVIAETDREVTLDGVVIDTAEFTPIGASGFSVARIRLASSAYNEFHRVESAEPFGVQLYGYAFHTAYSSPGGLGF